MATPHGKTCQTLFDEYDLSTYFNQANVAVVVDPGETTTFGVAGSSKTYLAGLNDGKINLSGLFDGAASATDAYFASILGSSTDRVISVAPAGTTIGYRVWIGYGIASSYEVDTPVADIVSTSAEFQPDGGLLGGVSLWALATASASANGTSVDNAASSANGGVGHYHLTANTRNNTVDMKIQHSTDNSVWVDLITFTQLAAATTGKQRSTVAGTINRYTRAVLTLGAGTGACTPHVNIARR